MNPQTTICAISTPPGTGGIATARISGPEAFEIVNKIWKGKSLSTLPSHTLHLGLIIDPEENAQPLDSAVAALYRAPRSFTGQDTIELSVHGSRWIQRELLNLLIRQGAVLAEPGEFTRRALQNGRLDLAEAEAVGDMIAADSRAAQRIALSHLRGHYSKNLEQLRQQLLELSALVELELDFSEEDVEFADRQKLLALAQNIHSQVTRLANSFSAGRAIKNGIPVAIVGATNAGKSTLLNRLLGEEKAIVSNIHGTTRDIIEDTVEINQTLFRFIDTAGLRQTDDPIETLGIDRSLRSAASAAIILWVIDPTDSRGINDTWAQILPLLADNVKILAVINKSDLADLLPALPDRIDSQVQISALTDPDLSKLTDLLSSIAVPVDLNPDLTVTNARHYQALRLAAESMARVIQGLIDQLPGDLLAQDLRETAAHIACITSPITTPALLTHIFQSFCIGK